MGFCFRTFKGKTALTLVEVLITTSLISLLSYVLYSSLVNGTKVWKKSQELVVEEDVLIFLDKISRDLQNVFILSDMAFSGSSQDVSFPAIIKLLADAQSDLTEGEYVPQMGRVRYYFDKDSHAIYSQQACYGQALSQTFSDPRKLVASVTDFRIKYYFTEGGKEVESDTIDDSIPSAINVQIECEYGGTSKILSRWIGIPVGR